ncbi:MAG: hypothetical protein IKC69_01535 [Clostridia bacterium]|nr:hypothetical protein [Clostridia bacterium]
MTKNIPNHAERKIRKLLESQRRLRMEKELLIALCLILGTVLGVTLILI